MADFLVNLKKHPTSALKNVSNSNPLLKEIFLAIPESERAGTPIPKRGSILKKWLEDWALQQKKNREEPEAIFRNSAVKGVRDADAQQNNQSGDDSEEEPPRPTQLSFKSPEGGAGAPRSTGKDFLSPADALARQFGSPSMHDGAGKNKASSQRESRRGSRRGSRKASPKASPRSGAAPAPSASPHKLLPQSPRSDLERESDSGMPAGASGGGFASLVAAAKKKQQQQRKQQEKEVDFDIEVSSVASSSVNRERRRPSSRAPGSGNRGGNGGTGNGTPGPGTGGPSLVDELLLKKRQQSKMAGSQRGEDRDRDTQRDRDKDRDRDRERERPSSSSKVKHTRGDGCSECAAKDARIAELSQLVRSLLGKMEDLVLETRGELSLATSD